MVVVLAAMLFVLVLLRPAQSVGLLAGGFMGMAAARVLVLPHCTCCSWSATTVALMLVMVLVLVAVLTVMLLALAVLHQHQCFLWLQFEDILHCPCCPLHTALLKPLC